MTTSELHSDHCPLPCPSPPLAGQRERGGERVRVACASLPLTSTAKGRKKFRSPARPGQAGLSSQRVLEWASRWQTARQSTTSGFTYTYRYKTIALGLYCVLTPFPSEHIFGYARSSFPMLKSAQVSQNPREKGGGGKERFTRCIRTHNSLLSRLIHMRLSVPPGVLYVRTVGGRWSCGSQAEVRHSGRKAWMV